MLLLRKEVTVVVAALLIVFSIAASAMAAAVDQQICDVAADFALGVEDYPRAIVLHRKVLQSHKNDALAHYHLGFAYGMVGQKGLELTEYLEAAALGLHKWDLFLNLGLAYLEQQQLPKAAAAFETAESLGPEHAETHLNLAIVYERERRLHKALQEVAVAHRLAPEDPDAANTNAIMCAEAGDLNCARRIWTQLVQAQPDYAPARANLLMLSNAGQTYAGEMTALALRVPAAAFKDKDGPPVSLAGVRNTAGTKPDD
jgi:Flp pilus assembly protein TadD